MLRQTTDFREIFAMHTSDKESFPTYAGSVYNSIIFKKPNLKMVKDMNRVFTKKMYKWPINTISLVI